MMDEAKPDIPDVLKRLNEVLDVLSKISEDLQDISMSLRTVSSPAAKSFTPQLTTEPTPQTTEKATEDIRMMFSKQLEALLIFEDEGTFIKVTPRQYLGSDNFAKIASTIREAGGEYVSAGKGSHFRIPK